jgi:uncharacterized RDD family membrane protein YckC
MEFLPLKIDGKGVYAAVVRRGGAYLIDSFIKMMPFKIILCFLKSYDSAVIALLISFYGICVFYNLFFVAVYGATPGYMVCDIRVAKPDGGRVSWVAAWKRYSIFIVFYAVLILGQIIILNNEMPAWYLVVKITFMCFVGAEILCMLFNKRIRAIHDFIAGTIVIKSEFSAYCSNSQEECGKTNPDEILVERESV